MSQDIPCRIVLRNIIMNAGTHDGLLGDTGNPTPKDAILHFRDILWSLTLLVHPGLVSWDSRDNPHVSNVGQHYMGPRILSIPGYL